MTRWGLFVLFALLPTGVYAGETVEKILAAVDGNLILLSDLRRDTLFLGEDDTAPLFRQVERRVRHQLLLHEARRFVLDPPETKEVEQHLNAISRRFKNKTEFQNRLKETGLTIDTLKDLIADQIRIKALLHDRIGFFIFVSDDEIKQYDQQHRGDLVERDPKKRHEQIYTLLKEEKGKVKTEAYIEQLTARANIQIYPP